MILIKIYFYREIKDENSDEDLDDAEKPVENSENNKNSGNEKMEADGSVNAADEFNFDKYDEECKF